MEKLRVCRYRSFFFYSIKMNSMVHRSACGKQNHQITSDYKFCIKIITIKIKLTIFDHWEFLRAAKEKASLYISETVKFYNYCNSNNLHEALF